MIDKKETENEKFKKFYLPSILALSTGFLDCYLTSQGLKDGVGTEGNFYYDDLHKTLGDSGIYIGKGLLLTALIPTAIKNDKIWPISTASLANTIGAGSWILSYYLNLY